MITFERATIADAPALTALSTRVFDHDSRQHGRGETGGPPGYNDAAWQIRLIERAHYYKISAAGVLVGGFVVYPLKDEFWELGRLYIDPAYQNQGIGAQALGFIESAYPQAKRWALDTPTWALRNQYFYEKHGYIRVGEMPVEGENITIVLYEKQVG